MYQYRVMQWLFVFYFYCFAGWCFESAYVSIRFKKFTNRGFMRGPFLPIYGSGATMMLVVSMPFQDNIILTYLAGCVGATILEYVTGVTMEALFKVRYWDYSRKKFNYKGHICLSSTLAWGFFTILMTNVIHIPVEKFMYSIPPKSLNLCTMVFTIGFVIDFTLSFKAAIDLRILLEKMAQAKEEMSRVQKRLDVMVAFAGEAMENRKDAWVESVVDKKDAIMETVADKKDALVESVVDAKDGFVGNVYELRENIEGKLDRLKIAVMQSAPGEYLDSFKDELIELKTRYTVNREKHRELSQTDDIIQRDMILSNPTMTSSKYKDVLDELRQEADAHRHHSGQHHTENHAEPGVQ